MLMVSILLKMLTRLKTLCVKDVVLASCQESSTYNEDALAFTRDNTTPYSNNEATTAK
ncbi:hypothetical protein R6Q59_032157, partial [Mikania micrantha]